MGIATSCVQNGTPFRPPRSLTALTKTYSSPIFSLSISDSIITLQVASVRNQGVILILSFLPSPNYIYFICKFFDFPFRMYPQSVFSPLSPWHPPSVQDTTISGQVTAVVSSLCSLLPLLPPHRVFPTQKPEKRSFSYLYLSTLYTVDKPLHDLAPACI